MDGHSVISPEVLARYAADAAVEVAGVRGVVASPLHRRGVKVTGNEVEVHVVVDLGVPIPDLARAVQGHVADYLFRMAAVRPAVVHVVVDEVAR
jgi:uncharacterized alkaline shock family protein YloU